MTNDAIAEAARIFEEERERKERERQEKERERQEKERERLEKERERLEKERIGKSIFLDNPPMTSIKAFSNNIK